MNKILVIQTAFIGDVILSTSIGAKLIKQFPDARIDYVVRKGNEGLIEPLSFVNHVWIWDKKYKKTRNLFRLICQIRKEKYDAVINLQRFFSSGLLTSLSKGKKKIGFKKNPLSFLFTHRVDHEIGNGKHEVERNQRLIEAFTNSEYEKPILNVSESLPEIAAKVIQNKFICIAPASVWYTKQFPVSKWIEFVLQLPKDLSIIMLGAPADRQIVDKIQQECLEHSITDLCGKVSLLESAAIMQKAVMNYVNDSAPLHLASAMNAPVRAVFCSTVPDFGFGPLSTDNRIIQVNEELSCRPCGLHGKKECPIGTFECATKIDTELMAKELRRYLAEVL